MRESQSDSVKQHKYIRDDLFIHLLFPRSVKLPFIRSQGQEVQSTFCLDTHVCRDYF